MDLTKPIPFPDPEKQDELIRLNIANLTAKKEAYQALSTLSVTPQWPVIRQSIKSIIDQYTDNMVSVKDTSDMIRYREAIKAYRFLLGLPESAMSAAKSIGQTINALSLRA